MIACGPETIELWKSDEDCKLLFRSGYKKMHVTSLPSIVLNVQGEAAPREIILHPVKLKLNSNKKVTLLFEDIKD